MCWRIAAQHLTKPKPISNQTLTPRSPSSKGFAGDSQKASYRRTAGPSPLHHPCSTNASQPLTPLTPLHGKHLILHQTDPQRLPSNPA